MHDDQIKKTLQRKSGISGRKAIPADEARRLSQAICERLASSPAYQKASVILSYSPFGGEADVKPFNKRAQNDGKTLALPICRNEGLMLAAVPETNESLEAGKYGIIAPIEERSRILTPSEIQLVIVPCAAFEGSSRMRIGMGAGYYDRYLPKCINAVFIAVAYEAQHITELATDKWDIPLDAVVTEANWY